MTTIPMDDSILHSAFGRSKASKALRICCYGSSSSQTPEAYLHEARRVGYLLGARGHVCVNGAGSYGCMAGLNEGASAAKGHIVGVIHEMWLVDQQDWTSKPLRDGGAHPVFYDDHRAPDEDGPIREILVAGGSDLQERKRLLVEGADGVIVLPGGPGTWDELMEMACARNIGLSQIPIVCVNVNGYYDPFRLMLKRAHEDELIKLQPHEIIHFEDTAEAAVRWMEEVQTNLGTAVELKRRKTLLRRSSAITVPILGRSDSWFFQTLRSSFSKASSWISRESFVTAAEEEDHRDVCRPSIPMAPSRTSVIVFVVGVAMGILVASRSRKVIH